MTTRHLIAIAGLILVPQTGLAQDLVYQAAPDLGASAMSEISGLNMINEAIMESAIKEAEESERRSGTGPAAPADNAVQPARLAAAPQALRFTASPERRRANLASFVERTAASDPAGAKALRQTFASTDVIGAAGRALSPMGLRVDNLADAYAVYWVTAWHISRGQDSAPAPGQMQAVKRQAERAMLAVPQLAKAGDAEKQKAAEAYLVQAVMMPGMFDGAKDAAQRQQLAAAVRQGAKASGLDLDAFELTPAGFTTR